MQKDIEDFYEFEMSHLLQYKADLENQYARLLENPKCNWFSQIACALMHKINRTDIEILAMERVQRQRQQAREPVDWNSEINHYTEGHRQFLLRQLKNLTN